MKGFKGFQKGERVRLGIKHTKETKKKMSLSQIGKKRLGSGIYIRTEEHRRKLSISHKGKIPSNLQIMLEKAHLARRGTKASFETRIKMSKAHKGSKAYNYKGNSTQDYLERRKFQHIMQKQVFERDNWTCQLCGSKKDLQVDHIQSWKDYVELRFSLNNCRTLCMKCHYKITYGKSMPENIKSWGHNFIKRGDLQ